MSNPNTPGARPSGSQVRTASGINIVLGVWLIISAFVFRLDNVLWNNIIVGAVVVILAWIRVSSPLRNGWLSWVNVLLGIWMVISPFVIGYEGADGTTWNNIISGVLIAIFGTWSALVTPRQTI